MKKNVSPFGYGREYTLSSSDEPVSLLAAMVMLCNDWFAADDMIKQSLLDQARIDLATARIELSSRSVKSKGKTQIHRRTISALDCLARNLEALTEVSDSFIGNEESDCISRENKIASGDKGIFSALPSYLIIPKEVPGFGGENGASFLSLVEKNMPISNQRSEDNEERMREALSRGF